MNAEDVKKRFDRDVAEHQMTVLLDNGIFRHIRFGQPGTSNASFYLTTWPMHLCFSGDMGTYVFSRLEDMFEFFRGRRANFSYWAEKVQAEDKHSKTFEFSRDLFEAALKEDFESFWERHGGDDEAKAEAWEDIEDRVFEGDETVAGAVARAHEFEYEGQQVFTDFWENRLEDYTLRFMWCCHALVWAIAKYDAEKAKVTT